MTCGGMAQSQPSSVLQMATTQARLLVVQASNLAAELTVMLHKTNEVDDWPKVPCAGSFMTSALAHARDFLGKPCDTNAAQIFVSKFVSAFDA